MRLFTALLPSAEAAGSLAAELAELAGDRRVRWTDPEQWHVTLGFFGDRDDPQVRSDWLRPRLADRQAPTVWLQGAGTFDGVLWTGVHGTEVAQLAGAAGAERDGRAFRAHLSLARAHGPAALQAYKQRLDGYVGPPWTASEVVLMRSDRDQHGARYTILRRFRLASTGQTALDH